MIASQRCELNEDFVCFSALLHLSKHCLHISWKHHHLHRDASAHITISCVFLCVVWCIFFPMVSPGMVLNFLAEIYLDFSFFLCILFLSLTPRACVSLFPFGSIQGFSSLKLRSEIRRNRKESLHVEKKIFFSACINPLCTLLSALISLFILRMCMCILILLKVNFFSCIFKMHFSHVVAF